MDIIQKEKNGIVCVFVKYRTTAELTLEFEEVVKKMCNSCSSRLFCQRREVIKTQNTPP
jgi:hypothetical protein